ncbi:hypothetical protein LK994_03440 [Ferruginibacter lapsinanis]|nr:hypothetical protein [Ferruginibacter lapsinanis]UEG50529.1 hypothetical protein LK994_03440 [Ferruginibacter lapsinanis]
MRNETGGRKSEIDFIRSKKYCVKSEIDIENSEMASAKRENAIVKNEK